jgi:hypothetical protein
VLIVLADHANHDGTGAWPSVATIARVTGLSERTVQRKLRALEAAELIAEGDQRHVIHIPVDRRPRVYDLLLKRGDTMTPRTAEGSTGVTPATDRGDISDATGCHGDTQPTKNHPEPPPPRDPSDASEPSLPSEGDHTARVLASRPPSMSFAIAAGPTLREAVDNAVAAGWSVRDLSAHVWDGWPVNPRRPIGLLLDRLRTAAVTTPPTAVAGVDWCGKCMGPTHRWVELPDGTSLPCARCSPQANVEGARTADPDPEPVEFDTYLERSMPSGDRE